MSNNDISMRGAAIIQFASKYASIAVQLIITAILSRLVSAEEFGLMSIINVFTAFFQLFSDMGLGTAIIQFRNLDDRDVGGLFFFSCLMAVVLTGVFCVASIPISVFYGDSSLIMLCIAASPSLLFSTLNMVPNGLMLRNRCFSLIGMRLIVATTLSGVVATCIAFGGGGAYSLVAQTTIMTGFVFVWNFISQPIKKINFHFMEPLKKVFSYSAYQFGFTAVNYFSRNLDKLIIGRVLGTAATGYYDKAYKLTTYPLSSFASIIGSIIQPFMAEHQHEPDAIYQCWMRVSKVLSVIGVAISVIFFCASSEIINLFYGPGWSESTPIFTILSITVYFQIMGNPSGGFFQSSGRTDLMFRSSLITTSLTILGLVLGLAGGSLISVAFGIAAAFCLHMIPLVYYLIIRAFGKSIACLKAFLPEVIVGVLSAFICKIIAPIFPTGDLLSLLCKLVLLVGLLLVGYQMTGQIDEMKEVLRR